MTDTDGQPIANARVGSDCGCDYMPEPLPKAAGHDRTDENGYYSYRVQRAYALNAHAMTKHDRYMPGFIHDATKTRTAAGYRIDYRLARSGAVAGTLTTNHGEPAKFVAVALFDAGSGKRAYTLGDHETDAAGSYRVTVAPGTYIVQLSDDTYYTHGAWYGGTSKADATPVVVAGGETVDGIDGVVAEKSYVHVTATVDGAAPIRYVHEGILVTLRDASGAVVARGNGSDGADLVRSDSSDYDGFAPGDYTLSLAPRPRGSAFFTPVTVPLTIEADTVAEPTVDLTSTSPSASDPADVAFTMEQLSAGRPHRGEKYRVLVTVQSYGDTTGGRLTFRVGGEKVATKIVPASGEVRFHTRFHGIPAGHRHMTLVFHGTDTAHKVREGQGILELAS